MFVFLADAALDRPCKRSKTIVESIGNVALDYLQRTRSWKVTIFIQSQIPELAELTMYYMIFIFGDLERNQL